MFMAEDFNQSIDLIPEDDEDFTIFHPIIEDSISEIGVIPYDDTDFTLESDGVTSTYSETSTMIPTSQYGWSSDTEMPSEYINFVLGSDRIVFFNNVDVIGSEGSTTITVTGSGSFLNRTGYSSTWSGNKNHTVGNICLSTVDIVDSSGNVVFYANYSLSGEVITPTEPDLDSTDLSGVIEELKIIEQNQADMLVNDQQIFVCISIFIGIFVGQIFMLGLWRARRRG